MPQADVIQRDFTYGIVRDIGPQSIDPRALGDHINGLYEEDGSPFKRGGSVVHSAQLASPASHPLVWGGDYHFDAGQRTIVADTGDFYALGSDDSTLVNLGSDGLTAPAVSAMLESMLFIGGGYIYAGSRKTANYTGTTNISVTNGSKTVTKATGGFTANVDAGMVFQRGNERAYVVASVDSDTSLTLRDAYEGTTGAGITATFYTIYKITDADPYQSGPFYVEVANKLVTASGKTLKFTEELAPHDWDFTTIGGTNVPNEQAFQGVITGAGTIAQMVLVGTTEGLYTLEGIAYDIVDSQGNNNHRIQILTRELKSYGPMFTWNQALLVPCLSGIFLIDGVSAPERVSNPIDSLWRSYVDSGFRPGQGAVYADHYVQPILSGSTVVDTLIARLDRPIEIAGQIGYPWARAGGEGIHNPAYFVRTQTTAAKPRLLAANKPLARTVDCSGFFTPTSANQLDADGVAPEWVLVTRDYETGGLTENMVRRLRARYELVGAGATISVEYGLGISEVSQNLWDSLNWVHDTNVSPLDLYWEDDFDDVYNALSCALSESNGLKPQSCRVNTKARFIRYRLRNTQACERLRLRSIESFIRPSMAGRR